MIFRTLALTAALIAPSIVLAQQSVRLRGTVDAIDESVVSMTSTSGEAVKVTMTDDYMLVVYRRIAVSDLAPGDFLSIPSVPGADSSKIALSINVFPEDMRGFGEGERPWDMTADSLMTNATIGTVAGSTDGNILTVTYDGVAEQVIVPDATPITRFAPDAERRLQVGDKAIVFSTVDNGTVTGNFAGVSEDGSLPPV
ncbi:MAG: hypothetical protein WA873_11790 [Jannaschia helgolandensis]